MLEEKPKSLLELLTNKVKLARATVVRVVIAASLVVLLALMFPRGEEIDVDYKVGAVWAQKDLIAPFTFAILREEREYTDDVERAKQSVYPVFDRLQDVDRRVMVKVENWFRLLDSALDVRRASTRGGRNAGAGIADSLLQARLRRGTPMRLAESEWELLGTLRGTRRLTLLERVLKQTSAEALRTGVLDRLKASLPRSEIALRKGTGEEILQTARVYDLGDFRQVVSARFATAFRNDAGIQAVGVRIADAMFEPNIRYSEVQTQQALDAAINAVPRTNGFVQANERIVSKHERITGEAKLKLESLAKARAERGSQRDYTMQRFGIGLHVVLVVMLYGLYLSLFRKRIFGSNRRLALIALTILLICFTAFLTRRLDVNAPIEFLIVVPVASMLLTIIFDSRVGFYGTVTLAFLVAGIRGNDYAVAFSSLIAGALSVYTVRDMRNRTQIFRSLGFIFLGYALSVVALGVERFESLQVIGEQTMYALANAVVSPVLTYGLLVFFERFFKVTTDVTLMELAHFNHPLLRRLAAHAPGTYHHSVTLASLAESAAAAIGANEMLARAGALFHDIGKLVKPMYFVENQKGSRNRHDKLTPRMSSLIISSHVKEGIALAEEHHLPQEVIDFIPMHHGTTKIEFFYNKALQLASASDDETKLEEINEEDYRYPGPKPQTRESGILMLADAVEAGTRTLEDPTPQRLEAVIDEIIRKRFEEGELDECPLTLKDLTKIKAAFLTVVVGISHTRVQYAVPARRRTAKPRRAEQSQGAVESGAPQQTLPQEQPRPTDSPQEQQ